MNNEKEIEEMAEAIKKARQPKPIEYDDNSCSYISYSLEKRIAESLIDAV